MKKIILFIILFINIFINYYKVTNDNFKKVDNYIYIKKLNLKENINSYKNSTVDNGIIFLKESDFNKELYILAAHSGNSRISYFKNIDQLNKNDNILLNINGKESDFIVEKIYKTPKNGYIVLPFNSKNVLYLTTCDKTNKNYQLIIKCVKKCK